MVLNFRAEVFFSLVTVYSDGNIPTHILPCILNVASFAEKEKLTQLGPSQSTYLTTIPNFLEESVSASPRDHAAFQWRNHST